ncbi:PDE8A, partial [Symbiodinium pilosum]
MSMSNLTVSDDHYVFALVVTAAYFLVLFFVWQVR